MFPIKNTLIDLAERVEDVFCYSTDLRAKDIKYLSLGQPKWSLKAKNGSFGQCFSIWISRFIRNLFEILENTFYCN